MQQTTDPKVFNEVFGGIIAMSLWLQGAHGSFDSSSAVQIRCSKLFHRLAFVCILLDQVKIFKKKKKSIFLARFSDVSLCTYAYFEKSTFFERLQ